MTFAQAMQGKNAKEWCNAMKSEISEIERAPTRTPVALPQRAKAIGNKWMYANKIDENGILVQRRARFVATGFNQKLALSTMRLSHQLYLPCH